MHNEYDLYSATSPNIRNIDISVGIFTISSPFMCSRNESINSVLIVRWTGEFFYEVQRKLIGVQLQKTEAF